MRGAIDAPDAVAVGPYSHAVRSGSQLYCSGQTPLDPKTGALVTGNAGVQTTQCFMNLLRVLSAAGLDHADVVKVNVFLTDMTDFVSMNEAYEEVFDSPFPARTTIGVAALPLGASVEIELIAAYPEQQQH